MATDAGILVTDKPMTPAQALRACKAEIERMNDLLFDSLTAPNPHFEGSYEYRQFESSRARYGRRVLPAGWRAAATKYRDALEAMLPDLKAKAM